MRVPPSFVVEVRAPDEYDPEPGAQAYVLKFEKRSQAATKGARAALNASPTWAFNGTKVEWSSVPTPEAYALLRAIHPEFSKRPSAQVGWAAPTAGYVEPPRRTMADDAICDDALAVLGAMLDLGATSEFVDTYFVTFSVLGRHVEGDVVHVKARLSAEAAALLVSPEEAAARELFDRACAQAFGAASAETEIEFSTVDNVVSLHG